MSYPFSVVAVACVAVPLVGQPPRPCVTDAMTRVKNQCGFDLSGPLASIATDVSVEQIEGKGFRAVFEVKPARWNERSKVLVTFNCADKRQGATPPEELASQESKSASEVIEEEDAGGRYGRRVASQRPITASNWRGTVAYVDGLLGDGQLSPMTLLLACDSKLARPCIEVRVQPAIPRPDRKLDPIYELLQSIAHVP
jgi:hypothetical protein